MTINIQNFNSRAVEWLYKNLEFYCVEPRDDCDFLENLPCLKFEGGIYPYDWRLPSTGDLVADMCLGSEMALAYLVLIFQRRRGQEYVPDPEQLFLSQIAGAMKDGKANKWQHVGFFGLLESFTDCALNHPALFEGARKRLEQLTDDQLRERCKCILNGGIPPNIFNEAVRLGDAQYPESK